MEVWKRSIVPGSENLFVSDLGRVKFPTYVNAIGSIYKERITCGSRWYNKNTKSYYRQIKNRGKPHRVNRLVCFAFHGDSHRVWLDCVDHFDQDTENNRADNLRFTTNQLNQYNSDKHKGYRKRGEKFQAYVRYNNNLYSKTFETEEEAKEWYLAERAKYVQMAEQELAEIEADFQRMHQMD